MGNGAGRGWILFGSFTYNARGDPGTPGSTFVDFGGDGLLGLEDERE